MYLLKRIVAVASSIDEIGSMGELMPAVCQVIDELFTLPLSVVRNASLPATATLLLYNMYQVWTTYV